MSSKIVKFGRYTLLGLMARGGMGEIYHAQLQGVAGFEKRCIIKKIRRELASNHAFIERFLNEGRTLVALTHSNIVQIFDMGEVDGEYYLAMEYVQGADLRVLLRKLTPNHVPLPIALAVLLEVLRGLSYAHRATDSTGKPLGIVHGDISPSNVLISTEGEVKIIDFGIARGFANKDNIHVVQGKFAYMSPEQAAGQNLDCRTDVFSAGVVFYEMLAGNRPFPENADITSASKAKFDSYILLSQINNDVDSALDDIVAKALATDREMRFLSADAFFDALLAYAQEHQIICGQRETLAYFKPYQSEDIPMHAASADEFMAAALDDMLGAQSFGITRTSTLAANSMSDVSKSVSPDEAPSTNDPDSSSSSQSEDISETDDLATASPAPKNDGISDVSGDIHEDVLWNKFHHRRTALAQALLKLRYIGLGILVGLLAVAAYFYFQYAKSPEKIQKLRQTLNEIESEQTPDVARDSRQDEEKKEIPAIPNEQQFALAASHPFKFQFTSEDYHRYSKGLPFSIYPMPDNATVYVIEGEYRNLEGGRFILVPGHPAEIAIQAPGYKTCMYRVYFDESTQKYDTIETEQCGGVYSIFSLRTGRVEVLVRLMPLLASPKNSENTEMTNDEAKIETTQQADSPKPKEQTGKRPEPSIGRHPNPEARKPETVPVQPTESESTKTYRLKARSNRNAQITIGNNSCEIPCEISGKQGETAELQPVTAGRQIGIAQKLDLKADADIHILFCELTVRMLESYVPNDPAPYQAADIYVDGRLAVRQIERAVMIMPCGSHEIKALIHTDTGDMTTIKQVSLEETAPKVLTMRLESN